MCDVCSGGALVEQFPRGGDLVFGHESFALGWAPVFAGGFESGVGAFDGEFSFHLGEGIHDLEEKSAAMGCCVFLVSGGAESDTGKA